MMVIMFYVQNDDIMMCFLTAAVCSRLFHKKEKRREGNVFRIQILEYFQTCFIISH
jgi:hypothetical protein